MTRRDTTTATPNLLDDLLQRLAADEPPAQRALLQSFARVLLARARPDYFRGRAEGELVRQVLGAFDLLERTPHRGVGVRVRVNPDAPHRAIVDTVMSDRPFIVDTIREYLLSEGLEIEYLFHPVLTVERDREGRLVAIRDREPGGPEVSILHFGVRDHLDAEDASRLETEIHSRLEDVRLATDDFERMCLRLEEIAHSLERLAATLPDHKDEIAEIREFLRWIEQRGFVFLGYRGYDVVTLPGGGRSVQVERDSGLGILRREKQSAYWEPTPLDELSPALRARLLEGPILIVTKSNSPSRVRRLDRMDYIGIKKLDVAGEVVGEHRFLGLFTRQAYAEPAGQVPILRRKLERLLAEERIIPRSHDWQETLAIFHSFPKEELFLASVEELREDVALLREVEGTDDVRVRVRPDVLGRGVNVLVVLPAAHFSEEAHRRVGEELVRTFGGTVLYDHLAILEGEVSRIHYYLATPPERAATADLVELEHRIVRLVMSWKERLTELLEERHPPEVAHELVEMYGTAFPAEYTATVDPETALADIRRLEALRTTGQMQVAMRPHPETDVEASQLRIFAPHGQLILADLMPTLDNLGIRVLEADANDIAQGTPHAATLHSFVVQGPDRRPLDIEQVEPLLASALPAIRAGLAADYPLNRLILSARLTWVEVGVLLAYGGYAFQILAVGSRKALVDALTNHPRSARLLYEIFRARFDPQLEGDRDATVARLNESFAESLDEVDSIADDRTLRRLHNLVLATVRTNTFQGRTRERPAPLIALKFDSAAVDAMPRPRTAYDIYVYSETVEGVHLRRGKVARGGVRWSDRPDDFRTETLGLVKTQHVKNAVIVPVGAKGAFVLRRAPADRAALRELGIEAYRAYMRGLLDVTDTIVEDRVVHPPDTVVYDGEDPYLVVAADKGTATFSDIANAIAAEYEFWLGDAFASGGSHGYDHKTLAITARGVWECVRRHFREMGMDAETDAITVAGIGDMSGDVFGNGLLLSRHLKLVAAFDHRNIFLDPDPDPETSYGERRRLFELPASSWEDYDRSLLSAGGGVYKRGAKEIELSPEARARLGIEASVVNGETLIRA
ncbi:MAG: NAD-glutamate dehydrogenase domain-containing protein, partial [Gemmatimonadota bacterium]